MATISTFPSISPASIPIIHFLYPSPPDQSPGGPASPKQNSPHPALFPHWETQLALPIWSTASRLRPYPSGLPTRMPASPTWEPPGLFLSLSSNNYGDLYESNFILICVREHQYLSHSPNVNNFSLTFLPFTASFLTLAPNEYSPLGNFLLKPLFHDDIILNNEANDRHVLWPARW